MTTPAYSTPLFRLDVRDSTRDQNRRQLPLRNPFKCKR
jgi:hypothetical protein